jgi:hypothetical protein
MAMDQWVATSHNKNQKGKNKMSDFALIKYNDVKSFNITHLDFLVESYTHNSGNSLVGVMAH